MRDLVALILIVWTSHLWAYGPCDEDEEKFCAGGFHGETVKVCLHKNIEKVGEECRTFLRGREPAFQKREKSLTAVRKACKDDLDRLCPEDRESDKPMTVCLMSNGEKLKPACRDEVNRHIKEHLPGIKLIGQEGQ